jgi:hypothetical protein
LRNRSVILLNTFLFNDCTIFAAAEFTVKFSFADCLPNYIAKTEKQKLVDQINESKYISVIYGGFTDTAAIKEEIVYVRTCK